MTTASRSTGRPRWRAAMMWRDASTRTGGTCSTSPTGTISTPSIGRLSPPRPRRGVRHSSSCAPTSGTAAPTSRTPPPRTARHWVRKRCGTPRRGSAGRMRTRSPSLQRLSRSGGGACPAGSRSRPSGMPRWRPMGRLTRRRPWNSGVGSRGACGTGGRRHCRASPLRTVRWLPARRRGRS